MHAYRYLALRFHRTDALNLRNTVYSFYEDIARVNGVVLGGQRKKEAFESPKAPFRAKKNNQLQEVLDTLAKKCYNFYAKVDHDRMQERYGIATDESDSENEETNKSEIKIVPNRRVRSTKDQVRATMAELNQAEAPVTASTPEIAEPLETPLPVNAQAQEPCDIDPKGFLSNHLQLVEVFELYDKYETVREDKGEDQFQIQSRPPIYQARSRVYRSGIAHMSTSASLDDMIITRSTNAASHDSPTSINASIQPHSNTSAPSMESDTVATSSSMDSHLSKKRTREDGGDPEVSSPTSVDQLDNEPAVKRRA